MLDEWFTDIPNNADFYSHENQQFFVRVLEQYRFDQPKPVVFLPCAATKPISRSRTHCYLSPITRDPRFEKLILSEPQSVIPYSMEHLCPNYDYPPGELTGEDRWQLVRRVNFFLDRLKKGLPERETVYYVGSKHHFAVLQEANHVLDYFKIVGILAEKGIREYTKAAENLKKLIIDQQNGGKS